MADEYERDPAAKDSDKDVKGIKKRLKQQRKRGQLKIDRKIQ